MADAPKKLLIVDDEPDIRELLKDALEGEGHVVRAAGDGEEAVTLLKQDPADLVLSDMRMPKLDGTGLLKWIMENQPKTRVILMTAFAELKQVLDVEELGHRAFLMKPFKLPDLFEAVKEAFNRTAWAKSDEKFYGSVSIEDFIQGPEVAYTLYIRLPDTRFMRIAHVGDVVPREKLLSLKATKGIQEVWLLKEDFLKYQDAVAKLSLAMAKNPKIPAEKRASVVRHTCDLAAETLRTMGVKEEVINSGVETMEKALEVLVNSPDIAAVFSTLERAKPTVVSHAASSALLAGLVARVMGWSSSKTIQMLIQGAYLHDVGMLQLPVELQIKPAEQITNEQERALYEEHPILGYESLRKIKSLPKEVSLIALQHHENSGGSGFPQGLLKSDIFPMARLVSLIDAFLHEWERLANKSKPKDSKTALEAILSKDNVAFDNKDIRALEIAITEPDLKKAQRLFEKER